MNPAPLILGGLAGLIAAQPQPAAAVSALSNAISEGFTGLKLSAMRGLDPALLNHPNIRALLRVIRSGEGTADAAGYSRLFGGESFQGWADHPRRVICKTYGGKKLCSSAAGAYQFLSSTWDETARIMGLRDFAPASQDLGALGRIAARGALPDVLAGRFETAITKVAREWASMPGSPYGQPVITLARAASIYSASGGAIA